MCWVEKCSLIDDDKGSSTPAWIAEFGVDPARNSIERGEQEEQSILNGGAYETIPIGSITAKAILHEIYAQYHRGVEIEALKAEISELRSRGDELIAQVSELEGKAKAERETAQSEQAELQIQLESQHQTVKNQLDAAKEGFSSQFAQYEDKTKLDFELQKKNIDQLEGEKASLSSETNNLRSEVKAVVELSEIQKSMIAHLKESLALNKAEIKKNLVITRKENNDGILENAKKEITHPKARLEMHNFEMERLKSLLVPRMELLQVRETLVSEQQECQSCKDKFKAIVSYTFPFINLRHLAQQLNGPKRPISWKP